MLALLNIVNDKTARYKLFLYSETVLAWSMADCFEM